MVNSDQDRGGTSYDDDTQERGSLSSAVNDQFAIRSRRKGAPNTNQTGGKWKHRWHYHDYFDLVNVLTLSFGLF